MYMIPTSELNDFTNKQKITPLKMVRYKDWAKNKQPMSKENLW